MNKTGSPALREYGIEADKHWKEVMTLAEKYGFILQVLAPIKTSWKSLGKPNTYAFSK